MQRLQRERRLRLLVFRAPYDLVDQVTGLARAERLLELVLDALHDVGNELGVDNLLWSTDYPHHGCDWPETRRTVDEMFRGVPDHERWKMTAGNAMRLYGLG